MFKTLKDARRRSMEAILEKVGVSERTVDEQFDALAASFLVMLADLNESGAGLSNYLTKQKALYSDAEEFATNVRKIYDKNLSEDAGTAWPNCPMVLRRGAEAIAFQDAWHAIHHQIRASASMALHEKTIEPLRDTVTKLGPEIDATNKHRATALTDYDSYRRRLKGLEEKRDAYEAEGKSGTKGAQDTLAEITKFQLKVNSGRELYSQSNEKAKSDIIAAKQSHDEIMDNLLITTIVCQATMFTKAANLLNSILTNFPKDQVDSIIQKIDTMALRGGAAPAVTEKKKGLGLSLFSSKPSHTDANKDDDGTAKDRVDNTAKSPKFNESQQKSSLASASKSPTAATTSTASRNSNPFDATGNTFSLEGSTPVPTATKVDNYPIPPPPSSKASNIMLVKALFDNQAEDDDELSFQAGDTIEIIEKNDGGWWRGRLHGKEGLLPSNYVKDLSEGS